MDGGVTALPGPLPGVTALGKPKVARSGIADSPERELRRHLEKCREAHSNISNVWKSWRQSPSKVALAEALWPILEKRILNPDSQKSIPILNLVEDAFKIANDARRARVMAAAD